MYILGIGTHVTCGSALVKNGEVVQAINDERLVRKKMVFGFPRESILKILELEDISPSEIDYVAVATKRQHLVDKYVDYLGGKFNYKRGLAKQLFFDVGSILSKYYNKLPVLEKLYYLLRQPFFIRRRKKIKYILKSEFKINCPVVFIDHHYSHAAAAHFSSQFTNATVITLDSAGDGLCSKVYKVTNNKFEEINKVNSFNSPCSFYSYITHICGFKAGKHEGKITGLAAYGEPKYIDLLSEMIEYRNGRFENIGGVFFQSAINAIKNQLPDKYTKEDLAASIQNYTEDMLVQYVQYWVNKTNEPNVAIAGGIFANVLINQKIYEIPGVKSLFVHPGMSDEGIGLGAALALYYEKTGENKKACFKNVYLGLAYSNDEIKKNLEEDNLEYKYYDDVESEIASLLASGYVVARFNGKMEYGPRALGNRSLLYQPSDPTVNDWLNKSLQRTEFMPFAPSTLMEDAQICYKNVDNAIDTARFMTITFNCHDEMIDSCKGVVHIDGTARPQLVSKEDNESFYRIIYEFKKITGLSSVINTSFNIHEEPIVCSPADAIRAFKLGHLDYLAIGKYIVRSPYEITHELIPVKHVLN